MLLYCLIGEAVWMIQHLEDVLSHSITLKKHVKKPYNLPLEQGNKILDEYRSYTLGKAIKIVDQENIFPESLQQVLANFLPKRNWLIHKCMYQSKNDFSSARSLQGLFDKIKGIAEEADLILNLIEEYLIEFSEINGLEMSAARAIRAKYYENC
ncbi:Uncharacterised protein [Legionella hackeliae]|uniref:Uncharacterized protein n=3 Tax=Legionella TaxID=445 RepID=A0A0A8USY4_LEGHA|nr:hypothetical protein Lhac_1316 [Legionella hackeliae]CEK11858.1 protein of unknown function [Legionella hackeliae]STX48623.1 Uncharacterised protein [Legionella hackeliae]